MRGMGSSVSDATAKLTISLTPTPGGVLRVLETDGPAYDLLVWSGVLRELADEFVVAATKSAIEEDHDGEQLPRTTTPDA
jgi:hypothetical protein